MINSSIKDLVESFVPNAKIKLISQGNHSKAYNINNKFVLKVAKNEEGSKGLKKECAILNAVQSKVSVNIPKVLKTGVVQIGKTQKGYAFYTLVEGKKLTMEEFKKLSKTKKGQIAKDMATFLKQLHSIKCDVPYYINRLEELDAQFALIKQKYFKFFSVSKQKSIIKFYEEERKFTENNTNNVCLIHNDFSASNILFDDNNNLVGVIDFGDAGMGDEDNDFLCLLENSEEEFGRSFGKIVLAYYQHANTELALEKEKRKSAIWKYEELYYGTLYGNKQMINEALENIGVKNC